MVGVIISDPIVQSSECQALMCEATEEKKEAKPKWNFGTMWRMDQTG